jgi:putative protease
MPSSSSSRNPCAQLPELLAPAGDFDAACAALQNGADAVYTGLPRFSARADATNLAPDELRQLVAHAHALPRPRRVYVALNTLAQERDLAAAVEALEELADLRADGVILQDLGLARIAARCFPRLRLHASTQLAVHNLAGARALAALGFRRVVLARELSIAEAGRIAREGGLEVEVFVHGALCHSYSGLCLFSSHRSGRSGNRGRCAYCCREPFARAGAEGRAAAPEGFPFSMRDLALAPRLAELAASGVASLKIEGRMKSACYVACVTDYYRRKLDAALTPEAEAALVEDLQTIFSRPWTQLYASGRDVPAAAIIDPTAVGHRGAAVGTAAAVVRDAQGCWLRFETRRALEKHDGLQVEPPRGGKPFGFAVDTFRPAGGRRPVIALPAGATVEVLLPAEDVPTILPGSTIYCSASQAVRRRYPVRRPRPSECRLTRPVQVQAVLRPEGLTLTATVQEESGSRTPPLSATVFTALPLTAARQAGQTAEAIRRALERSGDTPWQVSTLAVDDPQGLFVPASALNETRRNLFDALTAQHHAARQAARAQAMDAFQIGIVRNAPAADGVRWVAKLDLAAAVQPALATADELVLHLGHLPPATARAQLDAWQAHAPRARLRLALPLITRGHEEEGLGATLAALLADGWRRWECADLGGWQALHDAARGTLDLTADWSLYGLNHVARGLQQELGIARSVASPEDSAQNLAELAAADGPALEVLAWQQTPLLLSETPPVLEGSPEPPWTLVDRRGGRLLTHRVDARWVTVAAEPFCLAAHLAALRRDGVRWFRADFLWSPPGAVRPADVWRELQAGRVPGTCHTGNFQRQLL